MGGMISAKAVDINETPAGQQVSTRVKSWKDSKTVLINGVIFLFVAILQILDLLTGANLLEPIVGVFVKDPAGATNTAGFLTQVYTALNIFLRFKTNAPLTLK